jgi:hypothetical protein
MGVHRLGCQRGCQPHLSRAAALADFPPHLLRQLDALLDGLKSASGAVARAHRFANARAVRISAVG